MSFSEYIKVFFLFVLLPCIIIIPMILSIVFNTRKLILKQFNTPKTLYLYIFSKNGPLLTIFGLYIAYINIRSADQQLVKFC